MDWLLSPDVKALNLGDPFLYSTMCSMMIPSKQNWSCFLLCLHSIILFVDMFCLLFNEILKAGTVSYSFVYYYYLLFAQYSFIFYSFNKMPLNIY